MTSSLASYLAMFDFLPRRTLQVFAIVFGVLFIVSLMKGRGVAGGLEYAALWSVITTVVFIVGRRFQIRRGEACALCDDLPTEQDENAAQHA